MLYHFVYDSLSFNFTHYMTLAAAVSCKILILNQKTIVSELGIYFTFSFMSLHLCLVLHLFIPEHLTGVYTEGQRSSPGAPDAAVFLTYCSSLSFPAVTQLQDPYNKHKFRCYLYIYLFKLPFIYSMCTEMKQTGTELPSGV